MTGPATPGAKAETFRITRRLIFALAVLVPFVWSIGFILYIGSIPRTAKPSAQRFDAIVVLTGGSKRVAAGFRTLIEGRSEALFISGVFADTRPGDLQALAAKEGVSVPDRLLACCVTLGFEAEDTRGNAAETARWVKARAASSILLVTSNYHMPRSLLELRRAMPAVHISPHSVMSDALKLEGWWRWPGSLKLLWTEYHKLLVAGFRTLLVAS